MAVSYNIISANFYKTSSMNKVNIDDLRPITVLYQIRKSNKYDKLSTYETSG